MQKTHAYLTVDSFGQGFLTKGLPVTDNFHGESDYLFDVDGSTAHHVGPHVVAKLLGKVPEVEEGKPLTFIVESKVVKQ